jgi:chromosome partitioning protein
VIVAIVNSKGGVGKSTLAGSLAVWLHELGHRVVLADCDSQQSSSEWIQEAAPELKVVRLESADQVLDELPPLRSEADYIVADGPGSQTETSRALLMWADLAVVPCKASMFEVRALDKNTSFVRQAQAIRRGPPEAIAVLSMVGRDYRLTKDMRAAASTLNLAIAATPVTLRQAYADAPGQRTVVWRMGYRERDAAGEIDALFRELLPEAGGRKDRVVSMRRGKPNQRANSARGR